MIEIDVKKKEVIEEFYKNLTPEELYDKLVDLSMKEAVENAVETERFYSLNAYREIISYLCEEVKGNVSGILDAVNGLDTLKFMGNVKATKVDTIKSAYMLEFKIGDTSLLAEWYPEENYACYQRSGYLGDDYSGFLLFPIDGEEDIYFCLQYSC